MSVASSIKGIVMPVPTPFLENGEVDERMLEEIIDFYLASAVQATFINGSFGQGPAMSVEQRKRTAELAVKRVNHRVPVMVHVGAVDPYTSSDLARHARSMVDQVKLLEFLAETEPLFSAFGRTSQLEALRLRGFDIKRFPRWPAKPLTEEARGTIRTALERLGVPLGKAR